MNLANSEALAPPCPVPASIHPFDDFLHTKRARAAVPEKVQLEDEPYRFRLDRIDWRQPRRTPQPQDGHSRGTMTVAGFVDRELRDRAQPAGQSIRACTGLLGLARPTSQGRDLGIDDDCSWAWDLRSTHTMVAITWAAAKSCLCTF